jgi:integration host factor subunit alpha
MTKADLVNLLFERVGLPKAEAHAIIELVLDNIKESLLQGEIVKVSGFGTFQVRKKGSRVGRNPRTLQEVEITPRRVVTFKASEQLKGYVEKGTINP